MMKHASKGLKIIIGALALASAWAALSAGPVPQGNQPQRRVTRSQGTSPRRTVVNFSELARRAATAPRRARGRKVAPYMRPPIRMQRPARTLVPAETPTLLRPPLLTPQPLSPAPSASFEALNDNETAIPPDTQGTVGPNHLMVTLNSEVKIQNKSGVNAGTVDIEDFWTSTGATGPFDPKVAYDHMSGRWIFVAMSDKRDAASSLLIGTSQTNDPTGDWDLYRVDADAADVYWADYPSLGYNKDWIVVTFNAFAVADDAFVQEEIYVFKKSDLYAGSAATHTLFHDDVASTSVPATTFDGSLGTLYLLRTVFGNIDFGGGDFRGLLEVSTITGALGSEVYTFDSAVGAPLIDMPWDDFPPSPGVQDFAPQLGTSDLVQTNDSRMLSLVYRNGSLWATHTVFLPAGGSPTRSAVQWLQFDPDDGAIQQFGRIDDDTAASFRAFPSLAVNSQNDVLIGYARFTTTDYPGGAYSFRAGTDSADSMQSEVVLKAGEATYYKDFGSGRNRWGDYSNTVVDPVNDLDMWTIQEYSETPTGADDLWGTWWGKIAVSPAVVKKRRGQLISD